MKPSESIVVHLVHGTWPRGMLSWLPSLRRQRPLTWYDEGSDFRAELTRLLGGQLHFEAFEWSGSNSIEARRKAADALRQHLAKARWRRPEAQHFVVAHSHGGNVALESIQDQRVSGLVTLATPFLRMQPCNPTRAEVWILDRALIGVIRLPLLLAMALLFWYRSTQFDASRLVVFLFYALVFAWILTMFCGTFMSRVRRELGMISFESKDPLTEVFNSIGKPELNPPASPVLAIRAENDEAAIVLAIARRAAHAWAMLWRIVPRIARVVAPVVSLIFSVPKQLREILGIAMAVSALLLILAYGFDSREQNLWCLLLGLLITLGDSIVGLTVSPLLFGASVFYALAFGWEMVYTAQLLEIQVTSAPVALAYEFVPMQGLKNRSGQLHHSLHEFPEVRALVASWIKGRVPEET